MKKSQLKKEGWFQMMKKKARRRRKIEKMMRAKMLTKRWKMWKKMNQKMTEEREGLKYVCLEQKGFLVEDRAGRGVCLLSVVDKKGYSVQSAQILSAF